MTSFEALKTIRDIRATLDADRADVEQVAAAVDRLAAVVEWLVQQEAASGLAESQALKANESSRPVIVGPGFLPQEGRRDSTGAACEIGKK